MVSAGLAAAGLACFLPQFHELWLIWTNDPLRSVGLLAVPASLAFLVAAWVNDGWAWQGSWWGLLPIGLCLLGARVESQGTVGIFFSGGVPVRFFPLGFLLFGYASGAVLLLGGARAWRASAFGLALLLLVNPVPEFFTRLVDIPCSSWLPGPRGRLHRFFTSLSPANR